MDSESPKEEIRRNIQFDGAPVVRFADYFVESTQVDPAEHASLFHFVSPKDTVADMYRKLEAEEALIRTLIEDQFTAKTFLTFESMAHVVRLWRRYKGIEKVDGFVKLLQARLDLNQVEKTVIFALHADVMEGIRKGIKGKRGFPTTYFANSDPESKEKKLERFRTNPNCTVFICNINAAVQDALDLSVARKVIFLEHSWNPNDNLQALLRVYNRRQTREMSVCTYGLRDQLEKRILDQYRSKMMRMLKAL